MTNKPPQHHTEQQGIVITEIENLFCKCKNGRPCLDTRTNIIEALATQRQQVLKEVRELVEAKYFQYHTDLVTDELIEVVIRNAKSEGGEFIQKAFVKTILESLVDQSVEEVLESLSVLNTLEGQHEK